MAKVYLIGGTPRVGKTTLTLALIKQKPMLAASTDAMRYTLRRVIDKDAEPDLFHVGKFTSNSPEARQYLKDNIDEVITQQNKESSIVWKSMVNFINSNLEDGFDIIVEGIAVTPELVSTLNCEYSVVFLGNQSDAHFETILSSARANEHDWMHSLEDETIMAFCEFNKAFSRYLEEESAKYNMRYIEVDDENFSSLMTEARDYLLAA